MKTGVDVQGFREFVVERSLRSDWTKNTLCKAFQQLPIDVLVECNKRINFSWKCFYRMLLVDVSSNEKVFPLIDHLKFFSDSQMAPNVKKNSNSLSE